MIMKKILYILLIIFVLSTMVFQDNEVKIPEDSIRFRIISNSNSNIDQGLKLQIKNDLNNNLFSLLENAKSKEETKQIILDNQEIIKETIDKYNIYYSISYGKNHFPDKIYNGVTYEEGEYESLVISLGEAQGENWWCVMYPPLCKLESNSNNYEEVEYKFFIKEIIDKFIS